MNWKNARRAGKWILVAGVAGLAVAGVVQVRKLFRDPVVLDVPEDADQS
jgi:hypothetical protein